MNSKDTQTRQLALEQALRQAVAALQGGRPQEAEWLAADVLKEAPTEPRALQVFGYALLQQGKANEAIAPLKSAARRARDPEIETQLAMAYQQAGHNDDAIEQLERAISRSPPFPPAFLVYGSLLTFLEQRDKAIEIVKRGLAIAPNFPDLLSLLGDHLMMRGDVTAGRNAYNDALKYAPTHVDALFGLARALQNDGDFAGAAALFRRILAVQPGDNAARIGLESASSSSATATPAIMSFAMRRSVMRKLMRRLSTPCRWPAPAGFGCARARLAVS